MSITCPKHGEFSQAVREHLKGASCRRCHGDKLKIVKRVFISGWREQAEDVHLGAYTYPLQPETLQCSDSVQAECPVHGGFSQALRLHLKGHGCPQCGVQRQAAARRQSFGEFAQRAGVVHGGAYVYPSGQKVANNKSKITVICPEHGSFHQTVSNHLLGQGCPQCARRRSGRRCNKV